jgi:ABC-type branched-subunit amino acid transport system substrate-binding protein
MSTDVRTTRARYRAGAKLVALTGAVTLAATACTSTGGGATGAPLNGLTDTTVKVGYLVSDISGLNLGFETADYGDTATIVRGIQAVVDSVNANGGAGGRTIEADIVPFNGGLSSQEQTASLCASFTQDKQVFAAVLDGQYQNNTLPCYRDANTLMIDQTIIAHDQTQFEEYSPYLWSPTYPEYGSFLQAELQALATKGFFQGSQGVQLMPNDDEVSRRLTESIAKPFIAAQGVTKVRVDYVDSTDQGTLGASSERAIAAGKSAGTDRVIAIGGARIVPVALAVFEASEYDSRWAMSTPDNPAFVEKNTDFLVAERREGMVGLGFSASTDVGTDQLPAFPDPTNPFQQQCIDILTQAGAAPPDPTVRENWRTAFAYCDATLFFDAAMDAAAPEGSEMSAEDFAAAVATLGTTNFSASTFGGEWGENIYASTNKGFILEWGSECQCFSYDVATGPITFAAPQAQSDPAASAPSGAATDPSAAGSTPATTP